MPLPSLGLAEGPSVFFQGQTSKTLCPNSLKKGGVSVGRRPRRSNCVVEEAIKEEISTDYLASNYNSVPAV